MEEVLEAAEDARKQGNFEVTVHGWSIRTRQRPNLPRCDLEVRDPHQGVILNSIVSLKRHLGLDDASTPSAKRTRRGAQAQEASTSSATAPAAAKADDDEEAPEDIWVACDGCGKWRQLPSSSGPLPGMWFCHLHPNPALASCAVPEQNYETNDGKVWEYGGADEELLDDVEDYMPDDMATAAAASDNEYLENLQRELQIREPMSYIAAANDLLNSPQVGFDNLCAAHKLTFSRGVFDAVVGIMKRIALHQPPAAALNLSKPADAALVGNLRLFLQTGTAQGGMSSRCALMPNTIAVATEMLRDETLNVFAACLRHGFKMSDFGRSFNAHILERVTACKDHIADLELLSRWGHLTEPINRQLVSQVQMRCKVPVADAAGAVATHGHLGLDACCEQVRSVLGLAAPIEELVANRPLPNPMSDARLRRLQAILKRGSCPPSLKSLQVAVDLCSDRTPAEEEATFAAHGVDKKEARPRILAYRDRIKEQNLLDQLGEEDSPEADGAAASRGGGGSSKDGAGASTAATTARRRSGSAADGASSSGQDSASTSNAAGAAAKPRVRRQLPLDDKAYLKKLQQRIGVRPPMTHGGKVALPSLECVAAAAEMRLSCVQGNQNDVDAVEMCEKYGIPLGGTYTDRYGREVPRSNQGVFNFLRDVMAQLTKFALLEVDPSALDIEPPEYDPALLTSLQMRLQFHSTPPAVDSIRIALDLRARPDLDLVTAAVSRRLEIGGKPHVIERMRRTRELLTELLADEPLDVLVTPQQVEEVRSLVKRSGLNIPSVGVSAGAIVKHGPNLYAACNGVREEMGHAPLSRTQLDGTDEPEEEDSGGSTLERPPPISDLLLQEIRRRVALRLKRNEKYLAAPKFYRAAADLCSPELRDAHWGKLRCADIEAVCEWHGIEYRKQRKAHLDRLREVRTYVKQLGPLEQLLVSRSAAPKTKDEAMHKNLQMYLQTANSVGVHTGGAASRCPPNLASIAVAVEWCRNEKLDVTARCIAYNMPDPCSKQCTERVRLVKDRILELKLLKKPKLHVPIDRDLVEKVRSATKVSVARAATAVAKHGTNVRAACEEVRAELGVAAADQADASEVVSESGGFRLFLSERSATGYMGVTRNASGKFFEARCSAGERSGANKLIGTFDSAVSAAVAYAKFRKERAQGRAGSKDGGEEEEEAEEEEEEEGEEEGGEEGEEEEQEDGGDTEEAAGGSAAAMDEEVDERVPVEILRDHGDGGDGGRSQKWLVRFDAAGSSVSPRESEAWVSASRIPRAMLAEYVERKRVEFNESFEHLLTDARSKHPSGVVCMNVDASDAQRCAQHLRREWKQGRLPLGGGQKAFGWTTYGKTLSPHDTEQQRTNTLLLTNVMLPAVRKYLPGFHAIEQSLVTQLNEFYDTNVELFYAHGLRQGPHTLKSTGFDVHQDTEDFDFIEYTVVVKLTPDLDHEKPSKMRVVGAKTNFPYGPEAGACGLFRARLYHASVAPESPREHLKIAYFFRKKVDA